MKSDELPNQQPQRPSSGHAIPEHWKVIKLRGILRKTNERNRPDWPLLSVVREQGVILRNIEDQEENHNFIPDDLSNYKVVRKGQFAMNKMKAWQGSYGISPLDGIVSPAYFVFDVKGVTEDFFNRAIRSREYVTHFARASDGVRIGQWDLSPEQMREIPILVPPYNEQAAIVRYLDHADEQIQRYIASKERLIALLEEERQALVHQAVILGLDPTVRLKPSGVEWLGDVPEHWGIRRLKTICYMKSGEGITATSIETEGEYPVYGGNGLRGYTFEFTHNGDYVLIGRQGALCGNIHVAREKFWASEHAVVATLSPNHVLEWFSALLEVMNLNQYSIAAAQPGLAVDRVMNLWAPIPPREEQAHIATRMGRQTERIDNIVNNARRQIDFMNEYRTRLIADVVTGQLDVREAAAQLLDDFSEEEPKDEYGLITDNMDHDSYDASQPPEEEPVTERETIL